MLPCRGTQLAQLPDAWKQSLEDRVAALEGKVGSKSIQEQFREQAEMLDERFLLVNQRLDGIATDVSTLKVDVNTLKKEMTVVREGVAIILTKLG